MDIDKLIAYENGELDSEESIELFQTLIDSGAAWTLQGSYGRTARGLINAGLCFYTVTQDWVNNPHHAPFQALAVLGRILPCDIGKRFRIVSANAWQVENVQQFEARIGGTLVQD
jgi:hypothetical protein